MTIGIYCLTFSGTEYVYIGQSIDIESRYTQHLNELRTETANYKLSAAYALFGKPELHILEKCSSSELDLKELEYIKEFNSIEKGLNCYDGIMPKYTNRKGYIPTKSKYDESTYYEVLKLCILDYTMTSGYIAKLTGTDSETVHNIRNLRKHTWLEQKYPEEYAKLREWYNTPLKKYIKETVQPKDPEYYPEVQSPDGKKYLIQKGQARKFAKEHKIPYTGFNKLLNNRSSSCSGWKLA